MFPFKMDNVSGSCHGLTNEWQKLLLALRELCSENFELSDDTILDKLYVYIENSAILKEPLDSVLPQIGEWLELVINQWNENKLFYGVKIFTIRFIGYIGSSHEGFKILNTKNVLVHIEKLLASTEIQNDSCLMVPLINVFRTVLKHHEGWDWLIKTTVWKYAISAFYEERSIYIKRAGVKFISLLISTSDKLDSDVGLDILRTVCEPLISNNLLMVASFNDCADGDNVSYAKKHIYCGTKVTVSSELIKATNYLCDILEDLLLANAQIPGKILFVYRSIINTHGSVLGLDILFNCSCWQDHQTFSLLLLMVDLSNSMRNTFHNVNADKCPLTFVYPSLYWAIRSMINQAHFYAVINFCTTCLKWCSKFKCLNGTFTVSCEACQEFISTMADCLRSFLHLHSYCFVRHGHCLCNEQDHLSEIRHSLENSPLVHSLFNKLSSEFCSNEGQIQKLSFMYVELGVMAITRSLNFITDYSSIQKIFKDVLFTLDSLAKRLPHNQNAVKTALLHLLTLASKLVQVYSLPYWSLDGENHTNIFTVIIRIIGTECSDHRVNITSLQTLCKVLKFHILPDLLEKGELLKQIDVRLQLCDMAILVFSLECKTSWEIRDTTVEVYQTMVDLASLIPWFVTDPFTNQLLIQILGVAKNDESAYVRASTLNFFSRVVRAKLFDKMVSADELSALAIKVLLEDSMPVARRAACELITALYITYVPCELNEADKIYKAIFHTTLNELDWEVKKAALNFWHCTIDKHLTDEKVPVHPHFFHFSKIPKADNDIKLRIIMVLNKLGQIGCLKAIWLGVNDDCDIKVSQEAYNIVQHLEQLDTQWNFVTHILELDDDVMEVDEENSQKTLRPKEFFSLLQDKDWRIRLEAHKNWVENKCDDLTSLLDHILYTNNQTFDWEHNAIDCY